METQKEESFPMSTERGGGGKWEHSQNTRNAGQWAVKRGASVDLVKRNSKKKTKTRYAPKKGDHLAAGGRMVRRRSHQGGMPSL